MKQIFTSGKYTFTASGTNSRGVGAEKKHTVEIKTSESSGGGTSSGYNYNSTPYITINDVKIGSVGEFYFAEVITTPKDVFFSFEVTGLPEGIRANYYQRLMLSRDIMITG